MISVNNLNKLTSHIKKMGYTVKDWGTPNSRGWYRPQVVNLKGNTNSNLMVIPLDSKHIVLYDYAGQIKDRLVVDITNLDIVVKETEALKKTLKELKDEQYVKFKERYDLLTSGDTSWADNTHPVAAVKKLNLLNSFTVPKYKLKPTYEITKPLCIPLIQEIGGDVVGCHIRDGVSKKYMIPDSQTKRAFNILQKGIVDPVLNTRIGYLSESYTTACEVAEACPSAFVACTAGLEQMLGVHGYLSEYFKDLVLILVCDKTARNVPNNRLDTLMEKIRCKGLPYLQLSKTELKYIDMTDFNDYALVFGKYKVKQYISKLTAVHAPLQPEVLGQTADEFSIVSRVDGLVHAVKKDDKFLFKEKLKLASQSFWNHLAKLYPGNAAKNIYSWVSQEALRRSTTPPRGVGIFEDGDCFIANLTCGRYVIKDGEIKATVELKPANEVIYVNKTDDRENIDLSNHTLQEEDRKKLYDTWGILYGEPLSVYLGVIGWSIQACYASFSDFRANMWLTGSSGKGKSAVIEHNIPRLFKGIVLSIINTTPAFIGQMLTEHDQVENSYVLCIDEMAQDSSNKRQRAQELIVLSRETASVAAHTISGRGTKDHKARAFRKLCAFTFSSTSHALGNMQDMSRFIVYDFQSKLKSKLPEKFDLYYKSLEEVNPKIMNQVLKHADKYKELVNTSTKLLLDKYHDAPIYSHMWRSLAAVLSGTTIFLLQDGDDIKETAAKSLKLLEPFFLRVIHNHSNEEVEGLGILHDIFRFKIKNQGFTTRMIDALVAECENNQIDSWRDYGVRMVKKGNEWELHVQLDKNKINKYFESKLAVDVLPEVYDKLVDRHACGMVTKARTSISKEGKKVNISYFQIPIPEDFIADEIDQT